MKQKQMTIFDLTEPEQPKQEAPLEYFTIRYRDMSGNIHAEDITATVYKYWQAVREWQEKNPDKTIIDIRSY